MEKHTIVWCIEAPQGNFLKEVTKHENGQRLLFTDSWYDSCLKFTTKEQADAFRTYFELHWLETVEHMIMD